MSKPAKKIILGPHSSRLIIDESQAFRSDPGRGTPAIVELIRKCAGKPEVYTGTYWCVIDTAEVSGVYRQYRVPQKVLEWLCSEEIENEIESIRWEQE